MKKKSKSIDKMLTDGAKMWHSFDGGVTIGYMPPGITYTGSDGKQRTTFAHMYKPEEYSHYPQELQPFVIFGDDGAVESPGMECVYSDRMFQWDHEKTDALLMKYFGKRSQYFNDKDPAIVEKFLQERFGYHNLKLHMIVQWQNAATGYPLWSFHFTK